ncbi:MAG: hypothetical protein R2734_14655 [Nocardioides sp.]
MAPEQGDPAHVGQVAREVRWAVEEALAGAERDASRWRRLRERLDAVGLSARGRAWREASVLLDSGLRQRPGRTHRQLGRIRQRRTPRGGLAPFWRECERALAPCTLTPHGYDVALGQRDPGAVWATVERVTEQLGERGYPVLVTSGTLLGLVREGGVIAHDDDIDLAVVLPEDDTTDAAGAARQWRELRARAALAGQLDLAFEERRASHCRAAADGGLKVDLFPAWPHAGRMFMWPHTYGELAAEDVLPPVSRRVAGHQVWLPRHPEAVLEVNYGPGWRDPDPTFRFDWDRAHERFAGFVAHLGGRRSREAS